jgi:hypothetical protein
MTSTLRWFWKLLRWLSKAVVHVRNMWLGILHSESCQSRNTCGNSDHGAGRSLLAPLRFCTLHHAPRYGFNPTSAGASVSEFCAMFCSSRGDPIATSCCWIRSGESFPLHSPLSLYFVHYLHCPLDWQATPSALLGPGDHASAQTLLQLARRKPCWAAERVSNQKVVLVTDANAITVDQLVSSYKFVCTLKLVRLLLPIPRPRCSKEELELVKIKTGLWRRSCRCVAQSNLNILSRQRSLAPTEK